ncbi:hypothetical protein [Thalassobellus sediminis]|uniref:hypothetical protein n=1 Tax=Thalassobellus sediminis TaxID=3367753 RepID=UPI0037AB03E0
MEYKWNPIDKGNSIGTIGSEDGKILEDEENSFGARITLEEDGSIAPYSITVGIYGLIFHTDFYSTLENAENEFKNFKKKVEKIIEHYLIDENNRDTYWNEKHNQLMESITE